MNAILGFTDALLAGVDGPLNEEQTASLGWVQRGGRDLLGLINEILDLSKIEAGKLTIDPRAVRSARARRVGRGAAPLAGGPEGDPVRLARRRRPGRGRARPAAGPPDPRQPARQRAQVHRRGRGPASRPSGADGTMFRVAVRDTGRASPRTSTRRSSRSSARPRAARRAPASASRSAAGWPGRWAATSRSRASPGRGSVFHLTLPLDCRPGRRRRAQPTTDGAPRRRRACCSASTTTRLWRRCSEDARRPRLPVVAARPSPSRPSSDARGCSRRRSCSTS